MEIKIPGVVHVKEFGCQAPLRFYENCTACPRFAEDCKDLMLGKELLQGRKKLSYNGQDNDEATVQAASFTCTVPLHYFEKSRMMCGHEGRCREEGLLLTLLSGRKELVYTQKKVRILPGRRVSQQELNKDEFPAKTGLIS